MSGQHPDRGFTLIEVLLVILVLGLLAAIVVAAAGGFTAQAEDSSCDADRKIVETAVESYFAQAPAVVIPQTGTTSDGYELTLVDRGFLRAPSTLFDVDADGALVAVTGSPCTI